MVAVVSGGDVLLLFGLALVIVVVLGYVVGHGTAGFILKPFEEDD